MNHRLGNLTLRKAVDKMGDNFSLSNAILTRISQVALLLLLSASCVPSEEVKQDSPPASIAKRPEPPRLPPSEPEKVATLESAKSIATSTPSDAAKTEVNSGTGAANTTIEPPHVPTKEYIVRQNDTLSSIATCHGLGLGEVIRLNNLPNPDVIFPGQHIMLPLSASQNACETSTQPSQTTESRYDIYIVKRGDTLSRISSILGIPLRELRAINQISSDLIVPGQKLQVPLRDRDKDGVPDSQDMCPSTPCGAAPDPKRPGCPAPPAPTDRDQDGIADRDDRCPDVPRGAQPDPARPGCPAPSDRDQDGVADRDDLCPDAPKGPQPDPARPGCPVRVPVRKLVECKTSISPSLVNGTRTVLLIGGNAGALFYKYLTEAKNKNIDIALNTLRVIIFDNENHQLVQTVPSLSQMDIIRGDNQMTKWRGMLRKLTALPRPDPMEDAKALAADIICGDGIWNQNK